MFKQKNILIIILFLLILSVISNGIFFYKSQEAKNEQINQIKQNEKLTTQIEVLQKEIEELRIPEKEDSAWKTYRNEAYGFEIDYPVTGWNLTKEDIVYFPIGHPLFSLCTKSKNNEKNQEEFCVFADIIALERYCEDYSWVKIIENDYECFMGEFYESSFEKEITTNSGIKGCQITRFTGSGGEAVGIFFSIPVELTEEEIMRPSLFLHHYSYSVFDPEQIQVFNTMISTVRFIEE